MSEAYSPEFPIGNLEVCELPHLSVINVGRQNHISIDTLSSRIMNPIGDQIHKSIFLDNNKWFFGYEVAGTSVPASRESRLKGMRNVLSNFEQYVDFKKETPENLVKTANYPATSKRSINGNHASIDEITGGGQIAISTIFFELANDNDPLAVTLAQLTKLNFSEKVYTQIFRDSLIAFQFDRFKVLSDEHLHNIKRALGKTSLK